MNYLSKSDFKIARSCHTKLYFKKKGYPSNFDENEYLEFLAKGGYQVGKLATLFFPDGIEISTGSDHDKAIELTENYLKKSDVTLFEAAIKSKGKLIRIDILKKEGKKLKLIEVKSKSYDSSQGFEKQQRELQEYIEDVAYQYFVLKEKYPGYKIIPYLYMPDKSKRTKIEGLNQLFDISEVSQDPNSKFRNHTVTFDETRLQEVILDDLLYLLDLTDSVNEMQDMVETEVKILLPSLRQDLGKIDTEINKNCFKCEFNLTDELHTTSGFNECWQSIPKVKHPVSDLYFGGVLGGNKEPYVNEMIQKKKLSMFDVPDDLIKGERGKRQRIQIDNTQLGKEWVSPALKQVINNVNYPLHFIDFETSIHALPMHKDLRPYEQVVFQWSCHTLNGPDEDLQHNEWLNLEPEFPNFKFAESLMEQVGDSGTPLMWSPYENTILKVIYNQMDVYGYTNNTLKKWIEGIAKLEKGDTSRLLDMNRIALENYFHPKMKGKTSIKWVLPAVLSEVKKGRIIDWLTYFEDGVNLFGNESGSIINPYNMLPKIEIYERAENVKDGTGAMQAYSDLLFGVSRGDEIAKNKYKEALLRYCKLDTLAMVIIWEYWRSKCG
ncbi:MAG: DUF2779 domain-containing protein [Bacteroidetes bacterium]|nr:DUF2779 domain-containing protein [Bacteroidota bacterium]